MSRASFIAVLFLVGALISVSCGGGTLAGGDGGRDSGNDGTSSGLPLGTTIASLTPAQAGRLCDWGDNKEGGYGRTVTCPDGSTVSNDVDMATCASMLPLYGAACPATTVGDIEDCLNATGPDLCALDSAPECDRFRSCPQ
jgi:hypothetical protein